MTNGELFFKTFPCLEQDEQWSNLLWWTDEKGKRQLLGDVYDSDFWNAEYKESTTKNDLGVDCISREQAIEKIKELHKWKGDENQLITILSDLPSITPTTKENLVVGKEYITKQALEDTLMTAYKHQLSDHDAKLFVEFMSFVDDLPSVTLQEPRKGEWLRMSDLSEQEDDRYKCSRCGNVIHHKNKMDLYTFNSWCGRCGSDNGIEVTV